MHLPVVSRLVFVSPTLQLKLFFLTEILTAELKLLTKIFQEYQGSPFELSEATTFSISALYEKISLEYPKETFAVWCLNFHTVCDYLLVMKSGEGSTHSHILGC